MTSGVTAGGHAALTDSETGLPNRLYFDTVFDVTFGIGHRGIPLTLILLEVDHFQEWYEKRDPTLAGMALRSLGLALNDAVRRSDVVARTEPSRFALALLDCDLAGAERAAERIFKNLAPAAANEGVTLSAGVASYNQGMDDPEDLIGPAEEAVRVAQSKGGNRLELHR